jgi:hypothetical protein
MFKDHTDKPPGGVVVTRVELDPAVVHAHLAILRELNAPPSVIEIAERLAAATSIRVMHE